MSGTNMLMHLNEFNVDTVLQHLTGKLYWKKIFPRWSVRPVEDMFLFVNPGSGGNKGKATRVAGHPTMVLCSDFPGGISGGMRDKILYSIMSIDVANIGVFVYFFISHLFFFICVLINYWFSSSVRLPRFPFFPLLFLLDPSWFVSFFNLTLFGAASSKQFRSKQSLGDWATPSWRIGPIWLGPWIMEHVPPRPWCYAMLCYILHC